MVQGQGTTENLRVAGKLPGPGSSLRFKITEALLKDCTEGECSCHRYVHRFQRSFSTVSNSRNRNTVSTWACARMTDEYLRLRAPGLAFRVVAFGSYKL